MIPSGSYAAQLRQELNLRSRTYSSGRAHVESYGSAPVIVFEPENGLHANFLDAAYTAITANPDWMRRFDKVHAQAARSLPKPQLDPARRWRELDSSMSSDALLMNIFCTPGIADSPAVRNALGVDAEAAPVFGWNCGMPSRTAISGAGLCVGPRNEISVLIRRSIGAVGQLFGFDIARCVGIARGRRRARWASGS